MPLKQLEHLTRICGVLLLCGVLLDGVRALGPEPKHSLDFNHSCPGGSLQPSPVVKDMVKSDNLTIHLNGSHLVFQWAQPFLNPSIAGQVLSSYCLSYEIYRDGATVSSSTGEETYSALIVHHTVPGNMTWAVYSLPTESPVDHQDLQQVPSLAPSEPKSPPPGDPRYPINVKAALSACFSHHGSSTQLICFPSAEAAYTPSLHTLPIYSNVLGPESSSHGPSRSGWAAGTTPAIDGTTHLNAITAQDELEVQPHMPGGTKEVPGVNAIEAVSVVPSSHLSLFLWPVFCILALCLAVVLVGVGLYRRRLARVQKRRQAAAFWTIHVQRSRESHQQAHHPANLCAPSYPSGVSPGDVFSTPCFNDDSWLIEADFANHLQLSDDGSLLTAAQTL